MDVPLQGVKSQKGYFLQHILHFSICSKYTRNRSLRHPQGHDWSSSPPKLTLGLLRTLGMSEMIPS